MSKSRFNPDLPYKFVIYTRMSSNLQSARSCDQQVESITRGLSLTRRPWVLLKTYRDEAISGTSTRDRDGFQSMLWDIRTKSVRPSLILVDNYERFGREDELLQTRTTLEKQHGVLLLSADTGFADPTSVMGKVHSVIENIRSTEANRIKAIEVRRGKRDSILRGFWPGGPPPFGEKLVLKETELRGHKEVQHFGLAPDSESDWIMRETFRLAAPPSGLGPTPIAKILDADDRIPAKFKPFLPETIAERLRNEIYIGTLVWERRTSEKNNGVRSLTANPLEEILRVPGFCEAIVDPAVFDSVKALRIARSSARRTQDEADDEAAIEPIARGLEVTYLLSGLVYCSECKRRMTANSSSVYVDKAGVETRYVAYFCSRSRGGACSNVVRVPEDWLRSKVVDALVARLFPTTA